MPFLNHIILGNSIQNYSLFIAILVIGLTFKRPCARFLSTLLFRLLARFWGYSDVLFISLLLRPIQLLIACFVYYLAINQLDYPIREILFSHEVITNNISSLQQVTVIDIINRLFLFFFILSIVWIILRMIDFFTHIFMQKASVNESKIDEQIVPFLKELSKIITVIIGVFVVMGTILNLNVGTIIAGLGVGGIAIALAAQDTLKNLLGSFTVFIDKLFVVGDLIRIDKYEGAIEKVGFRSTRLRTLDKTLVIIPNNKMIDNLVENLTLRDLRRVKFDIGLEYNTPASTMMEISKEIQLYINNYDGTSNDTLIHFDSFGESSLNLQLRYYIETIDHNEYMRIREHINYKIMEIIAHHGAHFAFHSQTVYLHDPDKNNSMK